jgi:hypothetical protein
MILALRQPWLICVWWLCMFVTAAQAQYRFAHWTADNGLPQNSVRDIVQTRDGYLWLATFDGLARFDGVRFTVFNKSNSPGFVTNRFLHLYEDAQGDLWASAEGGVMTRLHKGRFTTYSKAHGLPENYVYKLGAMGRGGCWRLRWAEGKYLPNVESQSPFNQNAMPKTEPIADLERAQHIAFDEGEKYAFEFLGGQWQAWNVRRDQRTSS